MSSHLQLHIHPCLWAWSAQHARQQVGGFVFLIRICSKAMPQAGMYAIERSTWLDLVAASACNPHDANLPINALTRSNPWQ